MTSSILWWVSCLIFSTCRTVSIPAGPIDLLMAMEPGKKGRRSFFVNETGVIRHEWGDAKTLAGPKSSPIGG